MSDAIQIFFALVAVAFSLAFATFCLAWVKILPTIGLLWWMGVLQ